jgi:hypothetical protein
MSVDTRLYFCPLCVFSNLERSLSKVAHLALVKPNKGIARAIPRNATKALRPMKAALQCPNGTFPTSAIRYRQALKLTGA